MEETEDLTTDHTSEPLLTVNNTSQQKKKISKIPVPARNFREIILSKSCLEDITNKTDSRSEPFQTISNDKSVNKSNVPPQIQKHSSRIIKPQHTETRVFTKSVKKEARTPKSSLSEDTQKTEKGSKIKSCIFKPGTSKNSHETDEKVNTNEEQQISKPFLKNESTTSKKYKNKEPCVAQSLQIKNTALDNHSTPISSQENQPSTSKNMDEFNVERTPEKSVKLEYKTPRKARAPRKTLIFHNKTKTTGTQTRYYNEKDIDTALINANENVSSHSAESRNIDSQTLIKSLLDIICFLQQQSSREGNLVIPNISFDNENIKLDSDLIDIQVVPSIEHMDNSNQDQNQIVPRVTNSKIKEPDVATSGDDINEDTKRTPAKNNDISNEEYDDDNISYTTFMRQIDNRNQELDGQCININVENNIVSNEEPSHLADYEIQHPVYTETRQFSIEDQNNERSGFDIGNIEAEENDQKPLDSQSNTDSRSIVTISTHQFEILDQNHINQEPEEIVALDDIPSNNEELMRNVRRDVDFEDTSEETEDSMIASIDRINQNRKSLYNAFNTVVQHNRLILLGDDYVDNRFVDEVGEDVLESGNAVMSNPEHLHIEDDNTESPDKQTLDKINKDLKNSNMLCTEQTRLEIVERHDLENTNENQYTTQLQNEERHFQFEEPNNENAVNTETNPRNFTNCDIENSLTSDMSSIKMSAENYIPFNDHCYVMDNEQIPLSAEELQQIQMYLEEYNLATALQTTTEFSLEQSNTVKNDEDNKNHQMYDNTTSTSTGVHITIPSDKHEVSDEICRDNANIPVDVISSEQIPYKEKVIGPTEIDLLNISSAEISQDSIKVQIEFKAYEEDSRTWYEICEENEEVQAGNISFVTNEPKGQESERMKEDTTDTQINVASSYEPNNEIRTSATICEDDKNIRIDVISSIENVEEQITHEIYDDVQNEQNSAIENEDNQKTNITPIEHLIPEQCSNEMCEDIKYVHTKYDNTQNAQTTDAILSVEHNTESVKENKDTTNVHTSFLQEQNLTATYLEEQENIKIQQRINNCEDSETVESTNTNLYSTEAANDDQPDVNDFENQIKHEKDNIVTMQDQAVQTNIVPWTEEESEDNQIIYEQYDDGTGITVTNYAMFSMAEIYYANQIYYVEPAVAINGNLVYAPNEITFDNPVIHQQYAVPIPVAVSVPVPVPVENTQNVMVPLAEEMIYQNPITVENQVIEESYNNIDNSVIYETSINPNYINIEQIQMVEQQNNLQYTTESNNIIPSSGESNLEMGNNNLEVEQPLNYDDRSKTPPSLMSINENFCHIQRIIGEFAFKGMEECRYEVPIHLKRNGNEESGSGQNSTDSKDNSASNSSSSLINSNSTEIYDPNAKKCHPPNIVNDLLDRLENMLELLLAFGFRVCERSDGITDVQLGKYTSSNYSQTDKLKMLPIPVLHAMSDVRTFLEPIKTHFAYATKSVYYQPFINMINDLMAPAMNDLNDAKQAMVLPITNKYSNVNKDNNQPDVPVHSNPEASYPMDDAGPINTYNVGYRILSPLMNPNTKVTVDGVVVLTFRRNIKVSISVDTAISVLDKQNDVCITLSSNGFFASVCSTHGLCFQRGNNIDMLIKDHFSNIYKKARMWNKGVGFQSYLSPFGYLVTPAGTSTASSGFADLNPNISQTSFYTDTRYGEEYIAECYDMLSGAKLEVSSDGSIIWFIKNVKITQKLDGQLIIHRDQAKYTIVFNPDHDLDIENNKKQEKSRGYGARITTPYMHCTLSSTFVKKHCHFYIRQDEKKVYFSEQKFLVRNSGQSAGLTADQKITLNSN